MEEKAQGIKTSIESIIGSDTVLKRKKKTEEDISKELFERIILGMEEIQVREALLHSEMKLDFYNYDEKFYEVIDKLFVLHFGKEAAEMIFFYIYERLNNDGTKNEVMDQNNNVVPLDNPTDLWVLVNTIKNKKKK